MPCATSMPPPIFIGGLVFTSVRVIEHPWGTHNHIVQLPGFFIEILTLAEPEKLGGDGFSTMFGAYNRDFITRNEGFSLLILESKDAAGDADNVIGRWHRRAGRAALRA